MSFYTGLRSTAARMLGDRGQVMTLRKRTPGAYSPSAGSATVTATDYSATGAAFDFAALLIDGTNIQRGDKKVLLSAEGLTVEPDAGDMLVIAGTVYNVVAVQPVAPAGTVVVHKLQVRR